MKVLLTSYLSSGPVRLVELLVVPKTRGIDTHETLRIQQLDRNHHKTTIYVGTDIECC